MRGPDRTEEARRDLTGVPLPADYDVNGKSLVPFLFTDKPGHRQWIYVYTGAKQFIRGKHVMRDGLGKWWDVSTIPDDLISFRQIEDRESVSELHRAERRQLEAIRPRFDNHDTEPNKPGVVVPTNVPSTSGDTD